MEPSSVMLLDFLLVLNLCKEDCEDLCFKLDCEERCFKLPRERFDEDNLLDKLLETDELLSSKVLLLLEYIALCNSENDLLVLVVGSAEGVTKEYVETGLDIVLSRTLLPLLCQNFHLELDASDDNELIDGEWLCNLDNCLLGNSFFPRLPGVFWLDEV